MREIPYFATSMSEQFGVLVHSVSVDYEKIVDYMRQNGFDDDQIESTVIYISASQQRTRDTNARLQGNYSTETGAITIFPMHRVYDIVGEAYVHYYDTYRRLAKESGMHSFAEGFARAQSDKRLAEASREVSMRASKTLAHELRHRYHHLVKPARGKKWYDFRNRHIGIGTKLLGVGGCEAVIIAIDRAMQLPSQSLGELAVAAFIGGMMLAKTIEPTEDMVYYYDPEEKSARAASDAIHEEFIHVELCAADETVRKYEARQLGGARPCSLQIPTAL